MWHWIILIVVIMLIIGAYLNAANAYIYYRIGKGGLTFPDTQHSYSFGSGASPKLYVALGDSLTAGIGVSDYQESYPYLVAERLARTSPISLLDLSFPGYRSQDLISEFLETAVERQPDIVTVLIGTNDIHNWATRAQFEKNYRTIVETLVQKTDAEIYAVSIPYIGSTSLHLWPLNHYFAWRVRIMNDVIQKIADEQGITYIDIATPTRGAFMKDGDVYAADSFHPSAAGYRLWADILYADINR